MKRIEEEVYTEVVAAVAVDKVQKRQYIRHIPLESGRYRTVGNPKELDCNVVQRCTIDWSSFHPDLEDILPRELSRAFPDVPIPGRYQLRLYSSMSIHSEEDHDFKITVRANTREDYGKQYDYVSIQMHEDEPQLLDCYYARVLLVFKLPALSNQSWLLVKHMTTVRKRRPRDRTTNKQKIIQHPRLKRTWLKHEKGSNKYGIIDATTIILDKEHIIPDFDSNGCHCFVAKFMFFG